LIGRIRQVFLESQVGRKLSAVTLDEPETGDRVALSSNYLKIALPGSNLSPNKLLDIQVARVHQGLLFGYPAEAGQTGRNSSEYSIGTQSPLLDHLGAGR
jgi:hypothetical protein